jgi:hypothetical protein
MPRGRRQLAEEGEYSRAAAYGLANGSQRSAGTRAPVLHD